MNLHEMAKEDAEIQARNEAAAFENAMSKAFKVNDEVEAAYRQGYAEGLKSEAAKQLGDCIDTLIHGIRTALTVCIKRAKIEVGFAKETEKLQEQHWNECRQIAHYDDELRRAKELLKAAVEDIRHCMHYYDPCEVCSLLDKDGECPTTDDDDCKEKYKWCYEDEALALIGEDGEQNENN